MGAAVDHRANAILHAERQRVSSVSPAGTGRVAAGHGGTSPRVTLAAALLGFFVITLDAVAVNVALPSIRSDFNAGMTGLQWVVDAYALMFAALLLSAGALSDRIGAKLAFGSGMVAFVLASVACGLAPTMGMLVGARFAQGAAAAVMMPSSMALIGEAYPDPVKRARGVALWAMGGAVASTSGLVLGGVLTLASWRWIFFINVPVGAAALLLLARASRSPQRPVPFDWIGQVTAVVAMGGLTFGAIESGAVGFGARPVIIAFLAAILALGAFLATQARVAHPMMPLELFRNRSVAIASAVGFAFMVGYFGLPFVMSLYLQQLRDLSSFRTGLVFLPMMLIGLVLTPFSARVVERLGVRLPVVSGLLLMMAGLAIIAFLPSSIPVPVLSALMVLVGLAGPLTAPPIAALLLNSVPSEQAGTASGVYNTSRQLGGALAIAVFGAFLANGDTFMDGLRASLLIAAAVALLSATASLFLPPVPTRAPVSPAPVVYE
jgi:DHA2 family methylenomycin A resistance protein-like MFS transporter